MNAHTIRRFQVGDEAASFRVFFSAIHDTASRDYTTTRIQAWAPASLDPGLWAARIQGMAPWVVESAGEIVGYADVQPTGYIDHFFVAGRHARQGIGTVLMRRLHKEAARLGIATLTSEVSVTAQLFLPDRGLLSCNDNACVSVVQRWRMR